MPKLNLINVDLVHQDKTSKGAILYMSARNTKRKAEYIGQRPILQSGRFNKLAVKAIGYLEHPGKM